MTAEPAVYMHGPDILAELRPTYRIFISSPAGLTPERQRAKEVFDELAADYRKVVRLELLLWEEAAYRADRSFVEQIPEAAGFDVVICIVWDTVGSSPIPREVRAREDSEEPYESGTIYEFETARAEAMRTGGRPALFLFHKTADRIVPIDPAAADARQRAYESFKRFRARWIETPDHSFPIATETFATLDAFAGKFRRALADNWLAERLGIGPDAVSWNLARDGSPFVGLASFNATHRRVFKGRDTSIARVVKWFRDAAVRNGATYLLIRGGSGAGKSSLIRAGVAPLIATSTASENWRSCEMRPGDTPVWNLAAALHGALDDSYPGGVEALALILRQAVQGATAQIADILRRQTEQRRAAEQRLGPMRGRIFLFIDQLEEAGGGAVMAEEQAAFTRAVQALCKDGMVWAVAALRSDLEQALLQSPLQALADPGAWGGGAMPLAPPDAVTEIIEGPAHIAGLRFETSDKRDLAAEIRADLAGQTDALPLLQMTLEGLFERDIVGTARTLTLASYDALGRLPGAIARKADEVIANLDSATGVELDTLLRALVRGRSPAGQVVSRPMKLPDAKRDPALRALVDALAGAGARLLVIEDDVVRVAHEALLRGWPRAQAVADDEAHFQDVCRKLDEASRQQHYLAPGHLLRDAAALLERLRAAQGMDDAVALVERSLRKETLDLAAERRRRRMFQGFSAALLTLLILVVIAGTFAIRQEQTATRNIETADAVAGLMNADVERQLRERAGALAGIREQLMTTAEHTLASLGDAGGGEGRIDLLRGRLHAEEAETLRLDGSTAAARRAIDVAAADLARGQPAGGGDRQWQAAQRDVSIIDGELALETEDFDRARFAFGKATELGLWLLHDAPPAPGAVRAYARALRGAGDVAWQENDDAAAANLAYTEAAGVLRPLADAPDADPALQTDYLESQERVANILLDSDPAAALLIYRNNLARAEGLAQSTLVEPALQNSLSISREQLAQALIDTTPPDYAQARTLLTEESETRTILYRQDPSNGKLHRNLAIVHSHLGFVLKKMGSLESATAEIAEASRIFDELSNRDPADPRARREAAWAHVGEADLLAMQQACGKARAEYTHAAQLIAGVAPADAHRFANIQAELDGKRAALDRSCAHPTASSTQ